MRLLIAEKDYEIANAIQTLLERSNYSVDLVNNGDDAFNYVLSDTYDGVILDARLTCNGNQNPLLTLRQNNCPVPVLILTASDNLMTRVDMLNAGADDCLVKPFATTELLARVRAMLRRSENYTPDLLSVGDLSLNCTTYQLCTSHGCEHLTRKEFQLLECFMRGPGHLFTTEALMVRVWGWDGTAEINVLWTNINYLRRKLKKLKSSVQIQTLRDSGYRLTEK